VNLCLTGFLSVWLGNLTGCAVEDKWLVYKSQSATAPEFLYEGHVVFERKLKEKEVTDAEKAECVLQQFGKTRDQNKCKHPQARHEERPVITEDDQARILVLFEQATQKVLCEKAVKPFTPPPDARTVPMKYGEPPPAVQFDGKTYYPYLCDLQTRDKGGFHIDYKIKTPSADGKEQIVRLDDGTDVRPLYRFRIMAGPAYSTLDRKRKSYTAQPNASVPGQQVVTASSASNSAVDVPVLLKIYWEKRDILQALPLLDPRRINPVIGFNVADNPLKNLYAGLSVETFQGLDLIGGLHWSKLTVLTNNFEEQQATTVGPATREKYRQGWFMGMSVDVGAATAWLGKSTLQLLQ
jgi:hypothetical protein